MRLVFMSRMRWPLALAVCLIAAHLGRADEPTSAYIFPAGGQRGATVDVRVGAHFLHGSAPWRMSGPGIATSPRLTEVERIWFEGPVIPMPASQRGENYPRDHAATVTIAADAVPGARHWRIWTDEGATQLRRFIIGDLPEVVEQEIDGQAIPTAVTLPVTINGRIFPREDVDVWTFPATAGQSITLDCAAAELDSPLDARLELRGPSGQVLASATGSDGRDPQLRLIVPETGQYQARLHDAAFGGLQDYVYRLTVTAGPHLETIYPLGGRRGTTVPLTLVGQALPAKPVSVAIPADAGDEFTTTLTVDGRLLGPFTLQTSDADELLETEPNDTPEQAQSLAASGAETGAAPDSAGSNGDTSAETGDRLLFANGRIASPGDRDVWSVAMKRGEQLNVQLLAARLGSPLDGLLVASDAAGNELARHDEIGGGQSDARLALRAPEDGIYYITVSDRFAQRGGPEFGYRLQVGNPPSIAADFALSLAAEQVNLLRESAADPPDEAELERRKKRVREQSLAVTLVRKPGFDAPVEIELLGLPAGITVAGTTIPAKRSNTRLQLVATAAAPIGLATVRLRGTAEIDGERVSHPVTLDAPGAPPGCEELTLAVALPAPFRVHSDYTLVYAPRGGVQRRHYLIDRGGFEGPLTIRLADRQVRHLQGVTGPVLTIPPGVSEFDYPLTLPPWMEIGRTSRSAVMAIGEVTGQDGVSRTVSYSSLAQNDQIIIQVAPANLAIRLSQASLAALPGGTAEVDVQLQRVVQLRDDPVRVELILPAHVTGVTAQPLLLKEGDRGKLRLEFAARPGPFNMPVTIRATTLGAADPSVAEAPLELVSPGK